jgi:hypothetical protein
MGALKSVRCSVLRISGENPASSKVSTGFGVTFLPRMMEILLAARNDSISSAVRALLGKIVSSFKNVRSGLDLFVLLFTFYFFGKSSVGPKNLINLKLRLPGLRSKPWIFLSFRLFSIILWLIHGSS